MKNSWRVLASTLMCSVAFLGCTPEANQKLNEARKETAEAAKATGAAVKEAAGDAAKAASDATKSAVEATKGAVEAAADKAGDVKDAILDKAGDAADAVKNATSTDMAKLQESLSSLSATEMESVTNFQTEFSQAIGKFSSSIAQVSDSDTAKNAVAGVDEVTAKLTELATNFAQLPAAAKPYVAHVVQTARKSVQPAIDAILKNPAFKDHLEPALNALASKFDAFKV